MKKLSLLLLLLGALKSESQTEKDKWPYFKKFQEPNEVISEKQRIIQDYWKQYFKEDIMKKISSYEYYPLMLDSYGSPYADEALFTGADEKFFGGGVKKDANPDKYSMYSIFTYEKNKELLNRNLSTLPESEFTKLYRQLLNTTFANEDDFYNIYDAPHLKKVCDGIKEKLGSKKKILFFIHGYNVPYSLACVQADALMDLLKNRIGVNTDEILLVPVFWSSNQAKEDSILDESNFSTKNEESAKNGRKFWHYSNRAYYAALGLRKIINSLDPATEVLIFSHSLGTTIATTAFINTTSKLDFDMDSILINTGPNTVAIRDSIDFFKKADPITKDLICGMVNNKIPINSARIFLSAAAIPGQNTFCDIDKNMVKNKKFYIAINPDDIMLTKNVARRKFILFRWLIRASNSGSTTLGVNYENEAFLTKLSYPYKENFIVDIVSDYEDHEIFTYMNQPLYIELIKEWYWNTK